MAIIDRDEHSESEDAAVWPPSLGAPRQLLAWNPWQYLFLRFVDAT